MRRRNAYVVYLILETAISVAGGLYGTISAVYRVQAAGLNPLDPNVRAISAIVSAYYAEKTSKVLQQVQDVLGRLTQ